MYFKSNKDAILPFPGESRAPEVLLYKSSTLIWLLGKTLPQRLKNKPEKVQLAHFKRGHFAGFIWPVIS